VNCKHVDDDDDDDDDDDVKAVQKARQNKSAADADPMLEGLRVEQLREGLKEGLREGENTSFSCQQSMQKISACLGSRSS